MLASNPILVGSMIDGVNDSSSIQVNFSRPMPLFPLGLLQLTGMYLFVLPYVARRRDGPSPT